MMVLRASPKWEIHYNQSCCQFVWQHSFNFTCYTTYLTKNYLLGNKFHIFISSYEGESSSCDSFLICTWATVLSKCFLISSVSSVPSKPGRSSRIFSSNWFITVTVTWYLEKERIRHDDNPWYYCPGTSLFVNATSFILNLVTRLLSFPSSLQ